MRAVAIILLIFCQASAVRADGVARDYEAVFEGIQADERLKKWIKRIDQRVFRSPNDVFVGLPQVSKKNRFPVALQKVGYGGLLSTRVSYVRQNDGDLKDVLFSRFLIERYPGNHHILVMGVPNLKYWNSNTSKSEYSDFHFDQLIEGQDIDEVITQEGRCRLTRLSKDKKIQKTLILIVRDPLILDPNLRKQDDIACINRGHYFHFGYSNVGALPMETFSLFSIKWGRFAMDTRQHLKVPTPMLTGDLNGLARTEFLRALALRSRIGRDR